ncbi:MAG: HlyD family secretion protein [Deltaproteobacteria bacterium]|nr:HlyD family secretion protein [Deltaproteobacteria bacterium]
MDGQTKETKKNNRMSYKKLRVQVPVLLIIAGIIFGLVWWRYWANFAYTEDAQIDADLILISSPLPAYIDQLYVDEGDPVKIGMPLVRVTLSNIITDKDLKSARSEANIQYVNAEKELKVLKSQMIDAQKNSQRIEAIYKKGGINAQSVLDAKTRYEVLREQYESQQITAGLQKDILDATYNRLSGIILKSPINGVVSERSANIGQNMGPGDPIFGLVDLDKVWIVANFKETHVGKIKAGQKVAISVDTYPGVNFKGTVLHVENATVGAYSVIPSENPSGTFIKIVQRIPVKIAVDTEGYVLRPGMSVEVKVRIRKFSWL